MELIGLYVLNRKLIDIFLSFDIKIELFQLPIHVLIHKNCFLIHFHAS